MDWNLRLVQVADEVSAAIEGHSAGPIVLAESCTGGLAAAALVAIPGASNWFCGSSVVYREASKQQWLGISPELIQRYTTESVEVTHALSLAVLASTPEATLAAAITGHLESDVSRNITAPHVFVSVCGRGSQPQSSGPVFLQTELLPSETRNDKQAHAACILLKAVSDTIKAG